MGSVASVVIDEPSCASAPNGSEQKRSNTSILFEKSKEEAPRKFGQKLCEEVTHDIREYELVNNELMKLRVIVLE